MVTPTVELLKNQSDNNIDKNICDNLKLEHVFVKHCASLSISKDGALFQKQGP